MKHDKMTRNVKRETAREKYSLSVEGVETKEEMK
jgi:hypothetical protein